MTWNSTMGLISSIALALPIFFIISLRLSRYQSFPALLFYYSLFFIDNLLIEHYIPSSTESNAYWDMCKCLLEGPLLLTFLAYFSTSAIFIKKLKVGLITLLGFEITVLSINGFNAQSIGIITGPVYLAIIIFSTYLFIRQAKISIVYAKATGKAIIAAGILFAYGCYMIIYLMTFIFNTPNVADSFLVYFLVITFSSLAITAGIYMERKRIKKLVELKVTRKELSDMYKDSNTTSPLRSVVLDFDKDQWN